MSAKKVKAVKFYVPSVLFGRSHGKDGPDREDAYCIPATPEAYEAMRLQVAKALCRAIPEAYTSDADLVLSALGIHPEPKKKK